MQSSRDSSVWRSLAVAFGDGLAFGVGMTLTQPAGRASVAAPQTDLTEVAHRLEQMEQRIAGIEQTPRTLAPAERAALPSQPFDQKVLEAVVKALDARLHEHSGQVERQLTDLQAKVVIELQTLHQQDRSIADGLQARIQELQEQFTNQLAAVRNGAEGDRRDLKEQFSALRREAAELIASGPQARIEELQEQFTGQLAAIRGAAESDRQDLKEQLSALRREAAELIASGPQARIEELQEQFTGQLAAIRGAAESDRQDLKEQLSALHREAAELIASGPQARIEELQEQFTGQLSSIRGAAESDRLTMREQIGALHHDVADILAGQFETLQQQVREEVRESVGAMAAMAASAAESAIEERVAPLRAAMEAKDREIAELRGRLAGSDQAALDLLQGVGEICRRAAQSFAVPQAPGTPPGNVAPEAATPSETRDAPIDELPQTAADTQAIPGFAQPKPPGRLLRIPLVSSLVLTTGVMLMMHYL